MTELMITPDHHSRVIVGICARQIARKAVEQELRDAGVRVSLVRPAAINERANEYLAAHPELYVEALERAKRLGMYERKPRRSKVKTNAQTQSEPISTTSAVRMSCTK